MRKLIFIIAIVIFGLQTVFAQEDNMMGLFDDTPTTEYAYAAFKSTNVVIGQSIENPAKGTMLMNIQHHFGPVNSGVYNFFGFDQAVTRLDFTYGITDRISVGIGRSTQNKTRDGSLKIKLLRQSKGSVNMPVSVSYYGYVGVVSLKRTDYTHPVYFSSRLSFVNQIIIARKFSRALSLQLVPSMIHRNLVETKQDDNDVYSLGTAGRVKLSNRMSFNFEYHYILSKQTASQYHNSLSLGIDIETGGHVFQLFATNSAGITEQYFIPFTDGSWLKGDIHIGFNIVRTFTIVKPKEFAKY